MQRDEPAAGSLYLVGTPIGHLGDLSPRAQALLRAVDVIACEDTRHSGQLLNNLQAKGRRLSFHQHNTRTRLPQLMASLADGLSVAVISDAGLPGISDPGEELAAAAHLAEHPVICIPGPCAATAVPLAGSGAHASHAQRWNSDTRHAELDDRKSRIVLIYVDIRFNVYEFQ